MSRLRIVIAVTFACAALCAAPAGAQTEGKFSVGVAVTHVEPTDADVDRTTSIGPVVRLNPRRGWGVSAALNWFAADLRNPDAGSGDSPFARMRVRPLMAGVGYTIETGRLMTTFSVVGGPSFNSVDFDDEFSPGGATIDVETVGFAVRPGVGLTFTVAPRVAITGFGGYMYNRPDVTYRDAAGAEISDRWRLDSYVISTGLVFSLF